MRNRSISDVCDKLELALSDAKGELPPLATSSIVKARQPIGYEPLRYLFHTTASKWETEVSALGGINYSNIKKIRMPNFLTKKASLFSKREAFLVS